MKYPRILAALRSSRWAIQPASLQAIYDTLGAHMRGSLPAHLPGLPGVVDYVKIDRVFPEAALPGQASPAPTAPAAPALSVHVIPVYGIIGKHLSSLETMCGGCDLDDVEEEIAEAMADNNVRAIVLDFNSPGGVVTGVPELAAKIRAWSDQKPIYAFCDSLCASAAYWLASACQAIAVTQTADLGSIGVYIALVDDSEWWKKEGFKLELIKAGEFKAMGISGKPLSDAERSLLQGDVDAIYTMFTTDVRAGRGDIVPEVMQGQTFMGAGAVTVLLADEVVTDLPTMLASLTAQHTAPVA